MKEFFEPFQQAEYQEIVNMSAYFVGSGAQTYEEYNLNEVWEMYKNWKAAREANSIFTYF